MPLWSTRPTGAERPTPQRLLGAPSSPPQSRRRTMDEVAFTQRHGSPRSGTPSGFVEALAH
eukprot:4132629-Alexandrium_andersonii.AAC.1